MTELLIGAVALFSYALVSRRLGTSPVTAPMVFTTVGLATGAAGLGWFDLELEGEAVSILVEATLVLVLFTDAIRIDLRVLRREIALPGRLLGIGLPLTIAAGAGVALLLIPDLDVAEAVLLATVLAPTDAALGQAVVSNTALPARVRQALNVESGLNDGIAVPVVTVLLAIVAAEAAGGAGDWVTLAAEQIGFGILAGVAAGVLGGRLLDMRASAGDVEGAFRQLATLGVAVAAFAGATLLDGNGFIAAFTAGLAFGAVARDQCEDAQDFTEDQGELLAAVTFVVFGAVLIGPLLDDLTWRHVLYAIASLTVVRMVPVAAALVGTGMFVETRLFLAWFGPRGLASILFALTVLEDLDSPTGDTIFLVACSTVLLSVFAHGMTANSWSKRLAARLHAEVEPMPEMEQATEFKARSQRHL